jgi:hypothetical protein
VTRSEDQTPVHERWLWLEGLVSKPTIDLVSAGLPTSWPPTAKVFFVSYAYAEIPVGRVFDVAFPFGHPENAEPTRAVVHAVTQEWGKPFAEIPHGWKTICVIDFPDGEPSAVRHLATRDDWGAPEGTSACLSHLATMPALRSSDPPMAG